MLSPYSIVNIRAYLDKDKPTYPKESRISGSDLLDLALDIIANANYIIGGAIEFLECEDKPVLMDFYTNNGFKFFDTRVTSSSNKLNQLLKFI